MRGPASYRMADNGKVIISKDIIGPIHYSRDQLIDAIINLKRSANDFATEAAYKREMARYKGALRFLDANVGEDAPDG